MPFHRPYFFTLSDQQGNTHRCTRLGKLGDAQNRCHDHVDSGNDEHCRSNLGAEQRIRKSGLRLDLVPRSPHHCQMRTRTETANYRVPCQSPNARCTIQTRSKSIWVLRYPAQSVWNLPPSSVDGREDSPEQHRNEALPAILKHCSHRGSISSNAR